MDRARFEHRYGRFALVTGAAQGLGAAFARELAGRGLDLLLVDRLADALERTAQAIARDSGRAVRTACLDLAEADAAERVRAFADGLDVGLLVCNAAAAPVGDFLDQSPEQLDRVVAVNCRAPLRLAHAFGRDMAARGRGGIVLLSSLAATHGAPRLAAYAASKAFGLILAEGLWHELRPRGVDVLAVRPGATRTPRYERAAPARADRLAPAVLEPERVASEAIAALGSGLEVVPGRANRLVAFVLTRCLPRRAAVAALARSGRRLRPLPDP